METQTYYVIKTTTHQKKKVLVGDTLQLNEAQARPLRNGGFITPDKSAAQRIAELMRENDQLKSDNPEPKEASS